VPARVVARSPQTLAAHIDPEQMRISAATLECGTNKPSEIPMNLLLRAGTQVLPASFTLSKSGAWLGLLLSIVLHTIPASAASAQPLEVSGDADLAPFTQFNATPQSRQDALAAGRKASFFCANCHGEDGNSLFPEVPNLAGQHPAYLFNQIGKFASGERKNAYMQGLVKVLSEDERRKIVYYFANATAKPRNSGVNVARGKVVFAQSCSVCHGSDAHGLAAIPRLAGQPKKYLELTLANYREKTGARIFPPMSTVVSSLPQKDIDAVVTFLTSAP